MDKPGIDALDRRKTPASSRAAGTAMRGASIKCVPHRVAFVPLHPGARAAIRARRDQRALRAPRRSGRALHSQGHLREALRHRHHCPGAALRRADRDTARACRAAERKTHGSDLDRRRAAQELRTDGDVRGHVSAPFHWATRSIPASRASAAVGSEQGQVRWALSAPVITRDRRDA